MDPAQELVNNSDIPPIVVMKPQRETTDSDLRLTALHTACQRIDPREFRSSKEATEGTIEQAEAYYRFLSGQPRLEVGEMMGAGHAPDGKGTPYL